MVKAVGCSKTAIASCIQLVCWEMCGFIQVAVIIMEQLNKVHVVYVVGHCRDQHFFNYGHCFCPST